MGQAATKPARFGQDHRRERLRQIIAEMCFSKGPTFRLASGRESNFYFNLKKAMLDPEGIELLADVMLETTSDIHADYVGGLEMGAVPVVVAMVMKSRGGKRPIRGFWVRKEAKGHGTKDLADGHLVDGSRVIIVDDVTTSGGSIMQAIDEVKRHKCEIAAVITIVDRSEGAKEALKKQGIDLIAIFDANEFNV